MNTVPFPAADGQAALAPATTDLYSGDPNTFPQPGPPTVGVANYYHGVSVRAGAGDASIELYDGTDDTGRLIGLYVVKAGTDRNDNIAAGDRLTFGIFVKYVAGAGNLTGIIRVG